MVVLPGADMSAVFGAQQHHFPACNVQACGCPHWVPMALMVGLAMVPVGVVGCSILQVRAVAGEASGQGFRALGFPGFRV